MRQGLLSGFRVALALGAMAIATPTMAADIRLSLTYTISVAGFTVGQVDAEGRLLDGGGYAIGIRGYTRGAGRLVSDAAMTMGSNGFVRGGVVQPSTFEMESEESGLVALAKIGFQSRTVTELGVYPGLGAWPDRVPLLGADIRDVVDPLSAFLVPYDGSAEPNGNAVCNGSLPIFDGWQRFDMLLSYKETRPVIGRAGSYAGPAIICQLRYRPVAGHRPGLPSVQEMIANERMEAWLMPIAGTRLMLPYQLIIGGAGGDLVIRLTALAIGPDTGGPI